MTVLIPVQTARAQGCIVARSNGQAGGPESEGGYLMPRGHPAIGTALEDKPYFFSPGPDGNYHTLEDNLYSYEIPTGVKRE